MMGANEPWFRILLVARRHIVLDILEIVVRRQIQVIAGRNVVVHELSAILNDTESLIGVVLLSCLNVDEVLLDIVGLLLQLLLLFKFVSESFFVSLHSRLAFAQFSKGTHHWQAIWATFSSKSVLNDL